MRYFKNDMHQVFVSQSLCKAGAEVTDSSTAVSAISRPKRKRDSRKAKKVCVTMVARFFLVLHTYQNGEKIPNNHKIHQITTKYTK
jgi:hypothetical protein